MARLISSTRRTMSFWIHFMYVILIGETFRRILRGRRNLRADERERRDQGDDGKCLIRHSSLPQPPLAGQTLLNFTSSDLASTVWPKSFR
ncbi:MAG: hypothetical protein M5R36_02260 [Deltaproteobacteria bacterium]|nr:hypothetical protein [Deltaproteobacteria bacterium]